MNFYQEISQFILKHNQTEEDTLEFISWFNLGLDDTSPREYNDILNLLLNHRNIVLLEWLLRTRLRNNKQYFMTIVRDLLLKADTDTFLYYRSAGLNLEDVKEYLRPVIIYNPSYLDVDFFKKILDWGLTPLDMESYWSEILKMCHLENNVVLFEFFVKNILPLSYIRSILRIILWYACKEGSDEIINYLSESGITKEEMKKFSLSLTKSAVYLGPEYLHVLVNLYDWKIGMSKEDHENLDNFNMFKYCSKNGDIKIIYFFLYEIGLTIPPEVFTDEDIRILSEVQIFDRRGDRYSMRDFFYEQGILDPDMRMTSLQYQSPALNLPISLTEEDCPRNGICCICRDGYLTYNPNGGVNESILSILECGHVFHNSCIFLENKCPMCRTLIEKFKTAKFYSGMSISEASELLNSFKFY